MKKIVWFGLAIMIGLMPLAARAEMMAERKAADGRWGAFAEAKKMKVKGHLERLEIRLGGAIERIENLLGRVETRIPQFAARGANVEATNALVTEAKAAIAMAKESLTNLAPKIEAALNADKPRAELETLKPMIKETSEKIRTAHAAVVGVINSLKKNN